MKSLCTTYLGCVFYPLSEIWLMYLAGTYLVPKLRQQNGLRNVSELDQSCFSQTRWNPERLVPISFCKMMNRHSYRLDLKELQTNWAQRSKTDMNNYAGFEWNPYRLVWKIQNHGERQLNTPLLEPATVKSWKCTIGIGRRNRAIRID